MISQFSRTELLFGKEGMERLAGARVAVFGIGGVGGHAVEALARSGIGALDLIDNDTVSLTNINRQMVALLSTVGEYKVDVAAERIKDISPNCEVRTYRTFFMPDTADEFDFTQYDYVVDAIDTVTGKIEIIMRAKAAGVPIISSMGAGNKVDPTAFEVADIYDTSVCPLRDEKARSEEAEGGLLEGGGAHACRRYRRGQGYAPEHSGLECVCPLCCGTYHRRRGHKGHYRFQRR